MKKSSNTSFTIHIFIFLGLFPFLSIAQATEFDTLVVPSLMDSGMDGWYKIPPNSGPNIHRAHSVYQGQVFNLLILFRGYSADQDKNLHVRYDVQIYDPKGYPTDDKGTDLLAYQGPMGNPQALMLNQQYLKIVFTDKYQLGTYKIKVTAYDKISGNIFTSETPIDLIPFEIPEKFESQEEAGAWLMGYYQNPTPVKAISGIQTIVQHNPKWVNDNLNILGFFKMIFRDNPFLFKNIAQRFDFFSLEDQKKLLLIAAISADSNLEPSIMGEGREELQEFYKKAKEITIPTVTGEITSPVQLDLLWAEFLTTGQYDPIKKIVSALALSKYRGTIEKLKSGEIGEVTEEINRQADLEATYQSAIWSLVSNCKQMPLVFMYEYDDLDRDIKSQLGSILRVAQKKMHDEK